MIRRLRLKFVAMCMALVTAVLAVVILSALLSAKQNIEIISTQVLHRVIQEPSFSITTDRGTASIQPFPPDREEVLLPYFTVEVWPGDEGYTAYVTGGTYANLEDTGILTDILTECMNHDGAEGTIERYGLRYLRQDNRLYQKLAFVDMSMELAMLHEMLRSHLKIAGAAFFLLLGVSILLSCWATAPVERAWKQQRQFLSDASHELKTPLTVILSNAEMLGSAALDPRSARWVDNILSESQQMKKLVEEMLTLARADNAAPTAVMAEVSLSDAAADCALAFEPVAFEAGKSLEYQLADGVTVLGDRDRLRQVVSVLVDNAIKYGADGAVVTLTLQKTDRQARLTVSNPGSPIPPDQLSHLFERFYRADASRGEKSGFGLGLSIAAAIAAEHRGSLKAESDALSTRFIFTLPLKK